MLDATLAALARLRGHDAVALSQGLSAENAEACLAQAIRPFNRSSLGAACDAAGPLPDVIAIVVPAGVFTTPIEWTAIATASHDLPVPAGPIPKVTTFFSIASTYAFWPADFGRMMRPRSARSTS